MDLGEKELVRWLSDQLGSNEVSQADLVAAFKRDHEEASEELIEFLSDSKYFRRTGVGATAAWSVSANRDDDLRDFLAE